MKKKFTLYLSYPQSRVFNKIEMGKNYQLKFVSDEVWNNTPKQIQDKKKKYSNLNGLIKRREGKIERLRKEIKKTQEYLREDRKERTELLEQLQQFSEKYIPSVSPYQSVKNKFQWSVNIKIGDVKKTRYLGSNEKVRIQVDELIGGDMFYMRMSKMDDLKEELTERIRDIIQKNLTIELEKDFVGIKKKLKEGKIKIWDYLR